MAIITEVQGRGYSKCWGPCSTKVSHEVTSMFLCSSNQYAK